MKKLYANNVVTIEFYPNYLCVKELDNEKCLSLVAQNMAYTNYVKV